MGSIIKSEGRSGTVPFFSQAGKQEAWPSSTAATAPASMCLFRWAVRPSATCSPQAHHFRCSEQVEDRQKFKNGCQQAADMLKTHCNE